MKKFITYVLSGLLILIGFIIFLMCSFVLPSISDDVVRHSPEITHLQYPILLGMYATAIPFFYAIYATIKIIFTAEKESIYAEEIKGYLTQISYCAAVIILLYIAGFIILDVSKALPPVVAILGIIIIIVSCIVATAASFIRGVLTDTTLIARD